MKPVYLLRAERSSSEPLVNYALIKRLLDIVLAAAMLICVGPLLMLCALAVRMVSNGPAFIAVQRVGYQGRPLRMVKLRTMHLNADELLKEHFARCPEAAREWNAVYKLRNDPRLIPFIGSFLRKSSIDELPQLVNVLCGHMSLVGPRPFPEYHHQAFDLEFRALRVSIMPGLTGLWQVECRNAGTLDDQVYWDRCYIEQRSISLDVQILFKTLIVVGMGKSAY